MGKKSRNHTQLCQIWSNMKMSNNPAKYEVLIKLYLGSILDISVFHYWYQTDCLSVLEIHFMVTSACHNLGRITICVWNILPVKVLSSKTTTFFSCKNMYPQVAQALWTNSVPVLSGPKEMACPYWESFLLHNFPQGGWSKYSENCH